MIILNLFEGGKRKAFTLSYDDATVSDRHLVEIMNRYGIRGTFHLNSGALGKVMTRPHIAQEEVKELYQNHEVSCHGVKHRSLDVLSSQNVIQEILEDRRALEELCGYPVCGMSYANGRFNEETIRTLKSCGIVYARTVQNTNDFKLPQDFMKWHPTCHHKDCLENGKRFLDGKRARLFYVWGHSYEFDNKNNWELFEEFCRMMSGHEDVWYATNIEIYEYIMAQKNLVISADNKLVYNPSATRVWFMANEKEYSVGAGEMVTLE